MTKMWSGDENDDGHSVYVYSCPLDGCEAILSVVPEIVDTTEDSLSAAQSAESAVEDSRDEILKAIAGLRKLLKTK